MSHLSDPCWMGQHDRCLSPFCACDCGCSERNEGDQCRT